VAFIRQGADIPVLFDEPIIIGKFIKEKAVMVSAAEHAGIDIDFIIPGLFQEGLAL